MYSREVGEVEELVPPLAAAAPEPSPARGRRLLRALALGLVSVGIALGLTAAGAVLWFDHHLRAAAREAARGHDAAAARHLRLCQWVRPEQRDVLLLGARVARRSALWDEAQALLERYSARHGDDEPVVLERLLLRAASGELDASAPQLADRIRPGRPEAGLAREALVSGLQYRFRWAEAERVLGDWLAAAPDDTAAILLRGKLQEQRLQPGEALLSFRRVLDLDPEHDEARMRLTALLLADRRGGEAETHAEYLRRRLPANPEVRVQWARAVGLQGRAADARAALDDVLRAHPEYPPALAERGRLAAEDGDAAAEEYLERAARSDPGNVPTRHQYSLALARNGKKAAADREQAAARALEADHERINALVTGRLQASPNDPAVHHEIGLIALRSGQPAEALRWFQWALQVDPAHLPAHQSLAAFYHQTGNPALAARHRATVQKLGRAGAR